MRITPAYAGKSQSLYFIFEVPEDHPRLCGEKTLGIWAVVCQQGSPPPMRGKGYAGNSADAGDGITPAYAGKSLPNTLKNKPL